MERIILKKVLLGFEEGKATCYMWNNQFPLGSLVQRVIKNEIDSILQDVRLNFICIRCSTPPAVCPQLGVTFHT